MTKKLDAYDRLKMLMYMPHTWGFKSWVPFPCCLKCYATKHQYENICITDCPTSKEEAVNNVFKSIPEDKEYD